MTIEVPRRPGNSDARSTKGRRFPPEVLTPGEVRRLLDACSNGPMGVRNRALIAMLYRTGMRISEALALKPKDLDLDAGAIRILRGKGGRARAVGIDPGGAEMVVAWLVVRDRLGIDRTAPLFCTGSGKPLRASYIRVLLPRLGRRAEIEKRVHAHGLRHTHAAELRQETVDIGLISKQLGHRSISTTAIYLDHLAPHQVIERLRQRSWSAPR